jgi:hypothetical protein
VVLLIWFNRRLQLLHGSTDHCLLWAVCLQGQFNKLRGICVAAEQGMRSLVQRLSLALEAPLTVGPSAQLVTQEAPGSQSSAGQQAGAPGSRLTSAGEGGRHVGSERCTQWALQACCRVGVVQTALPGSALAVVLHVLAGLVRGCCW